MPRKTIDDVRAELRAEQDKNRKLRQELQRARRTTIEGALSIVDALVNQYPPNIFPDPDVRELEAPPPGAERYAAAGVRLAGKILNERLRTFLRGV